MTTTTAAQQRRRRILKAARKLFQTKGPRGTRMSDIAKEVGIAVGSVYLEFSSKQALHKALVMEEGALVLGAMDAAHEGCQQGFSADHFGQIVRARTAAYLKRAKRCQTPCSMFETGNDELPKFCPAQRQLLEDYFAAGLKLSKAERPELTPWLESATLALSALSPPAVFELEERHALEQSERLGALIFHGIINNFNKLKPNP